MPALLPGQANSSAAQGSLVIEWREEDGHVLLTGPTAMPFRGRLELDKL